MPPGKIAVCRNNATLHKGQKMLGEPHDLLHEFPEYEDKIRKLRQTDGKFARLMIEYNELDEKIRTLEENDQPVSDNYMEDLKKVRVSLKDQLYDLLRCT